MARAFQFDFLLQRAIDRREAAALAIGNASLRVQAAREQLAQIEAYRDEYRLRLNTNAGRGMHMHQWNDFQLFLAKLAGAIEQQMAEVERQLAALESARQFWSECVKEVKAFEALQQRHDFREAQADNRLAQRQSDEWSANMVRRRHGND
ncbi:flagellar export protein FliJ [Chitinimonas sp.]|uniref:flagellar export protein FliJ n=1 Tax=Chitinimonas sp. TaxID=1934313 RepID=UPI0035AF3145